MQIFFFSLSFSFLSRGRGGEMCAREERVQLHVPSDRCPRTPAFLLNSSQLCQQRFVRKVLGAFGFFNVQATRGKRNPVTLAAFVSCITVSVARGLYRVAAARASKNCLCGCGFFFRKCRVCVYAMLDEFSKERTVNATDTRTGGHHLGPLFG